MLAMPPRPAWAKDCSRLRTVHLSRSNMPLYTFRLTSYNDSPGPRVGTALSSVASPPRLPGQPPAPGPDHVRDDVLPGLILGLHRAVQLAQDKDAQLLALQQPPHLLHVEPADALAVQHAVHHLLQELLVLTEGGGGSTHHFWGQRLLGRASPTFTMLDVCRRGQKHEATFQSTRSSAKPPAQDGQVCPRT